MTYSALFTDEHGNFWQQPPGGYSYPVSLSICPACGAAVTDEYWHTNWHDHIEETKS